MKIQTPEIAFSFTTIREVLEKINRCPARLCVLVDGDHKVVRTLVDGDLRRALLSGLTLSNSAAELSFKKPVCLPKEASIEVVQDTFSINNDVDAIVLIDELSKPVGVICRKDIVASVYLSPPHLGDSERLYVNRAFDENWVAPVGPNINLFEAGLKEISSRSHALAVSSGTAALHLALRVLGICQNDRVYVSDLTFVASVQPILYLGAQPVLIDSEPQSWNISPEALKRKLIKDAKAGCLPKAVVVAHIYGQPADMSRILNVTEEFNVPVIEDAAESLGARYDERPSGSHGLMAVYSFNGNKIITTSSGGALVSDDENLINRAGNLASQGREPFEHYQHSQIAYNYRMSNILAGLGIGQLEVLQERVEMRRRVFDRYHSSLNNVPGVSFQEELPSSVSNRWLTVMRLNPDFVKHHPFILMRELRKRGVECRPAWKPMHMQPLLNNCEFECYSNEESVSDQLFLQSLCLPSGSGLSQQDQDEIIETILKFIKG